MRQQSVPGLAIGVVVANKVGYAKGFGLKNLDRKDDPVTTESLFQMASITIASEILGDLISSEVVVTDIVAQCLNNAVSFAHRKAREAWLRA